MMDEVTAGMETQLIKVEVAFALPESQTLISLQVKKGCTALEALEISSIAGQFPDYDFDTMAMGIFSRPLNGKELPLPADYVLEQDDRLEIYRPLMNDPKLARLERVRMEQRKQRQERDKLNKDKKIKRLARNEAD